MSAAETVLLAHAGSLPKIAQSVIHPRFVEVGSAGRRQGEGRGASEVDPNVFRATLGCFPTGVAIVTSLDGEMPVGMVVGSFASISLDPPLVGFFADLKSVSFREISRSGRFLVNVLGAEHDEVCRRFFRDREGRFQSADWAAAENGLPKFNEAIAWINCSIVQDIEIGDHMLVVGQVEELGRNQDKLSSPALVFHRGEFGASGSDRAAAAGETAGPRGQAGDGAR